jgi:hypothetical protein
MLGVRTLRVRSKAVISFALLLVCVSGCGGGTSSRSVQGKVTLDGAPLAGARLTMIPKDRTVKGPFFATTDDQGQFTIGSLDATTGGAPAGEYRLTITTAIAADTSETAPVPPERVPSPHNTGVDFTVLDGGTTDANFDLTSK